MIEPKTAADWRAVETALLADATAWTALADHVTIQPGLPRLLADDYADIIGTSYRRMARAAQRAAEQAALYAAELEGIGLARPAVRT